MGLFSFLKSKKNKTSIYKNEDSYKDILFSSENGSIKEVIFNRTNLKAPNYVVHSSKIRLYYNQPVSTNQPNKVKIKGQREFQYLTAEEFVKSRSKIIKFYWDTNFDNCKKRYSSYEEFFAINCSSMNKPRIKVITNG